MLLAAIPASFAHCSATSLPLSLPNQRSPTSQPQPLLAPPEALPNFRHLGPGPDADRFVRRLRTQLATAAAPRQRSLPLPRPAPQPRKLLRAAPALRLPRRLTTAAVAAGPWERTMVLKKLTDSISSKLAFFPPQPPSYRLAEHGDGEHETYIQPTQSNLKKVPKAQVYQLASKKETIVSAFIPGGGAAANSGSSSGTGHGVRWTLLHSHGNAVDLGEMLPLYEELARLLRCNVLSYDYAGYGCSTGAPAATQCLSDIAAVTAFLTSQLHKRPADLVLYGQSVGSGPTCHLAAELEGLGGVVLHAPFLSGMRVLNPGWRRWPAALDIFPNYKLVPKIRCPVLVMHGLQDEVIDVSHGKQLAALCQRPSEALWAPRRGHQDLEAATEYIPRLRQFLVECWGEEYRQHLRAGGISVP